MFSKTQLDNPESLHAAMARFGDARLSIEDINFSKPTSTCVLDFWIPCKETRGPISFRWFGKEPEEHWQLTIQNVSEVVIEDWDEPIASVDRKSKKYLLGKVNWIDEKTLETWSGEGLVIKIKGTDIRCFLGRIDNS